jgi:hypothetical protein
MKLVKLLGLAVTAALASMAFIGASSANATLICQLVSSGGGTGGCPSLQVPYNGPIKATSPVTGGILDTFVSGFVRVECEGKMEGEVTSTGSGSIKSVTWTNCKNNVGCTTTTAKAEGTPWAVTVSSPAKEGEGADMKVANPKGSFTISGGFFCPAATCIYKAETVLGEILDSLALNEKNTIHVREAPLLRQTGSSSACSETATWSALYGFTPTNLHIH